MDSTAIEKIVELSQPNIIESDNGFEYSDKPLYPIKEPKVKGICLSTLDSVIDLVRTENNFFYSPIIIHVEGYKTITVYSGLGNSDRERNIPYSVSADVPQQIFGSRLSYEEMMIALKSKFVDTPELCELVQLLGTITEENNMQIADDGFTQSVTVRKGIAVKGNKAINPIVELKPYRTFLEVDQPKSNFLIRLFEGGTAALFEADGGAWKLDARKNIVSYLKNSLGDMIENGSVIVVS